MTNAHFENLMETMHKSAAEVLPKVPTSLSVFREASAMSGRTPAQIAWSSMLTPLVRLRKMVMDDVFTDLNALRDTCADVIHYITYVWCLGNEDDTIAENLLNNSIQTLLSKNANYSSTEDRLHNFHVGAAMTCGTAAQAAWGYVVKHLVSLQDKVNANNFNNRDDFAEKCIDIINYTALIFCLGAESSQSVTATPAEDRVEGFVETIANTVDAVQSSAVSGFAPVGAIR